MGWHDRQRQEVFRRVGVIRLTDDEATRAELLKRCADDPVFFIDNFVWAFNPHEKIREAPFKLLEWQKELVRGIAGLEEWACFEDKLRSFYIDKSRKMGLTYVVLATFLWWWLFRSGAKLGVASRVGTEVWDKSEDSLFGKLKFMFNRLPRWMRPGRWDHLFVSSPKPVLVNPRNGSVILGAATTPDLFRGGRHDRVFVDEGASIRELRKVMESIDEVGPAIVVSTPKGMGNHFARLIHGTSGAAVVPKGSSEPGAVHLRYHYRLDPRKDAAWKRAKQAELTAEAWAQEYEIDYRASAPGRIWPEFDRTIHVLSQDEWEELLSGGLLRRAPVFEGWDFGSGRSLTAVAWFAYIESLDRLILLDYRQWQEKRFKTVAEDVGAAGYFCSFNPRGKRPEDRVGDIAGKARDSDGRSWMSNLSDCGIDIFGQSMSHGGITNAIATIREAITDGRFVLAPSCVERRDPDLPSAAEVLEQYRWKGGDKTVDEYVGAQDKPHKDIFSHLADAFQHVSERVWPMVTQGTETQEAFDGQKHLPDWFRAAAPPRGF